MRYRMLNIPEVAKTINEKTVPVMLNVTGEEFPRVPGLSRWRENHKVNPWAHMIFGVFIVLEPDGSRVWGTSSCQFVEIAHLKNPFVGADADLYQAIEHFHRARKLRARGDAESRRRLEELEREVDARLDERRECVVDLRLMTSRFLLSYGAAPWPEVVATLMPPAEGEDDHLEPGVRQAAIQALASYVVDDAPFKMSTAKHLEVVYENVSAAERAAEFKAAAERFAKSEDKSVIYLRMPPSLKRIAATAVGRITGQDWNENDPRLLETFAAWWKRHGNDAAYAIPGLEQAKGN